MPTKKMKPTSPGMRHAIKATYSELTASKPEKTLTVGLKKSGGRNHYGRITSVNVGGGNKTISLSRTSGTGTFTAPTSGNSTSVTVPSSGTATSSATFTYRAPTGSWTTTAFQATNASYSTAAATLSK